MAQENAELTFDVTCEAVIFFADTVRIQLSCELDLDTGLMCIRGPHNDIWFEAETETEGYLNAHQEGRLAKYGLVAPSKGGCLERELHKAPYRMSLEELPTGTFLCALTNEKRLSEVEIIVASCPSCDVVCPSCMVLVVSIRTFR